MKGDGPASSAVTRRAEGSAAQSPDIVLVPRWGGDAGTDWYPWLSSELGDPTVATLRPDPGRPEPAACLRSIAEAVPSDPARRRRTLLVGHSVGCQAILRYLAGLEEGAAVAGVLCVAGWWTVDEPWDSIRPWLEIDYDVERARDAAGRFAVLVSDDDPFTSDAERTAAEWRTRVGARVEIVPAAGHFNGNWEPRVLEALRALAADVPAP